MTFGLVGNGPKLYWVRCYEGKRVPEKPIEKFVEAKDLNDIRKRIIKKNAGRTQGRIEVWSAFGSREHHTFDKELGSVFFFNGEGPYWLPHRRGGRHDYAYYLDPRTGRTNGKRPI